MNTLLALLDAHTVVGAVIGSVVTVSSQKVYAFVLKQTTSAKAALEARVAALEAKLPKA